MAAANISPSGVQALHNLGFSNDDSVESLTMNFSRDQAFNTMIEFTVSKLNLNFRDAGRLINFLRLFFNIDKHEYL